MRFYGKYDTETFCIFCREYKAGVASKAHIKAGGVDKDGICVECLEAAKALIPVVGPISEDAAKRKCLAEMRKAGFDTRTGKLKRGR